MSTNFVDCFSVAVFLKMSVRVLLDSYLPRFSVRAFDMPMRDAFDAGQFSIGRVI